MELEAICESITELVHKTSEIDSAWLYDQNGGVCGPGQIVPLMELLLRRQAKLQNDLASAWKAKQAPAEVRRVEVVKYIDRPVDKTSPIRYKAVEPRIIKEFDGLCDDCRLIRKDLASHPIDH